MLKKPYHAFNLKPAYQLIYLKPYQASLDIYTAIQATNAIPLDNESAWRAPIQHVLNTHQADPKAFDFLKACVGHMIHLLAKAHVDIDTNPPIPAEENKNSTFLDVPWHCIPHYLRLIESIIDAQPIQETDKARMRYQWRYSPAHLFLTLPKATLIGNQTVGTLFDSFYDPFLAMRPWPKSKAGIKSSTTDSSPPAPSQESDMVDIHQVHTLRSK